MCELQPLGYLTKKYTLSNYIKIVELMYKTFVLYVYMYVSSKVSKYFNCIVPL